jgi:hypothetical protein
MDLKETLKRLTENETGEINYPDFDLLATALQQQAHDAITQDISAGVPEQLAVNNISKDTNKIINMLAKVKDYSTGAGIKPLLVNQLNSPEDLGGRSTAGLTYSYNNKQVPVIYVGNIGKDHKIDPDFAAAHEMGHVINNKGKKPGMPTGTYADELFSNRFANLYNSGALNKDSLENVIKRAR